MSRFFISLLLVLVVSMLSACSPIHFDELNGTSWYALQIGDLIPPEDIRSTLSFTESQFTGKGSCNTISGRYFLKEQKLSFENIFITLVNCMYGREQEKAFLNALDFVATYRVEGEQLYLLGAEGQTLVVLAPIQSAQISGPLWNLDLLNNAQQVISSLPEGVEITAQFVDKRVFGSAGCNQYFADYKLVGDRLSFSGVASTRMFCGEPEGVMEQESLFLQALEKAARFEIREQFLTVFDAEGGVLLQFVVAGDAP